MNESVMIVGGGGREHALGYKLRQEAPAREIIFAPGNAGTELIGTNAPIAASDIVSLANLAEEKKSSLTIVGPDLPLSLDIGGYFAERKLLIFGPNQAAARLEWSKIFAAEFMRRHGIPTADFVAFSDRYKALSYVTHRDPLSLVIKADGLAGGKGVLLPKTGREAADIILGCMSGRMFGEAGHNVLIQERLNGPELSVFALCDGEKGILLPFCRDYKRLKKGDKGPNTGGMGSFGPIDIPAELSATIQNKIVTPTLEGMAEEGAPYRGILYVGLILTGTGPKVSWLLSNSQTSHDSQDARV